MGGHMVVYRSVAGNIMGILRQWIQPLVLSGLFLHAVHGMVWYAALGLLIGGGGILLAFAKTKERTPVVIQSTDETPAKRMNFFKGMWMVITNFHVVRVFLLQKIVGISNSTFAQLGIFINIYYVWGGSEQSGSSLRRSWAHLDG